VEPLPDRMTAVNAAKGKAFLLSLLFAASIPLLGSCAQTPGVAPGALTTHPHDAWSCRQLAEQQGLSCGRPW